VLGINGFLLIPTYLLRSHTLDTLILSYATCPQRQPGHTTGSPDPRPCSSSDQHPARHNNRAALQFGTRKVRNNTALGPLRYPWWCPARRRYLIDPPDSIERRQAASWLCDAECHARATDVYTVDLKEAARLGSAQRVRICADVGVDGPGAVKTSYFAILHPLYDTRSLATLSGSAL